MSKAFTRDDGPGEDSPPRQPLQIDPGAKRYITAEGFRTLDEELSALVSRRSTLTHNESQRAQWLTELLPRLTIATPLPTDRVLFGSWVTAEDNAGEQR